MDAILKKMTNVIVAFDILKDGDRAPIGHKQINCHLIYNVKWRTSGAKLDLLPEDT